jgi:hypothetical protein
MGADLIGRTGTPFRVVVEEGKVREFARATDSHHPDHLRDGDPVSPLTFLISSVFWQDETSSVWAGVDRDYSRILHGEQAFTFHGPPPRAGDVLTGQQRIADVFTKEGKRGGAMEFTVVVTEFRDPDGELVVEMTSTTIVTAVAPPKE